MRVGSLEEIYRYPVKSMGGETLASVELSPRGLPGDRSWAVRDEVRGGIRGAKQLPALMQLRARTAGPPLPSGSVPAQIDFPDGTQSKTTDPDVSARISRAIDHEVTLWPLLPPDALDHYRRGPPPHEDMEQALRAMFGRTADEPLPDLSRMPPELFEFESPPGSYFDAFPILLLTRASLATMQARAPHSRIDVRRFRPNLVVTDTAPGAAFPERDWCGAGLRIGDALLRIDVSCPRCVMTTHGFDDLPRDPGIMRALVREAGGELGVYASVVRGGVVRRGDAIERVDLANGGT